MREHPVPQDITGYQFHIIGEMTIKQFAEVGAGVLLGVLIYATNLPIFFKWPLIIVSVAVGAMAAFVPFEEQPLDHWIITFFRSLYKPTQFYWKKDARLPDVFRYTASSTAVETTPEIDLNPARRQRIKEYLVSLPPSEPIDDYFLTEQSRLQSILASFATVETHSIPSTLTEGYLEGGSLPNLTLRPHSLHIPSVAELEAVEATTHYTKTSFTNADSSTLTTPIMTESAQGTANPSLNQPNTTGDILVPANQPIQVETTGFETSLAGDNPEESITYSSPQTYVAANENTPIDTSQLQAVINNIELPFPALPSEPNKVVGMTLSGENDLLHEVIIEIKTPTGQVVRAVKSNSLGQFFISTPLRNGTYIVTAEKEGYQFPDQQLILKGSVVHPLEIRSS